MTDRLPNPEIHSRNRRAPGLRGHVAGLVALGALAVALTAWAWISRSAAPAPGFGWTHAVLMGGACAFVAALIAEIRAMSFMDVVEMLWELVLGVLAAIGAVLKEIWNGFLALIGWD